MLKERKNKFFQVFFTEHNTAELLKGFKSKLGDNTCSETNAIRAFLLKESGKSRYY